MFGGPVDLNEPAQLPTIDSDQLGEQVRFEDLQATVGPDETPPGFGFVRNAQRPDLAAPFGFIKLHGDFGAGQKVKRLAF